MTAHSSNCRASRAVQPGLNVGMKEGGKPTLRVNTTRTTCMEKRVGMRWGRGGGGEEKGRGRSTDTNAMRRSKQRART